MKNRRVTAASFGKRIAKVMWKLKSSHVYFIMQQAYGDPEFGCFDLAWEEVEDILKKVIKEKIG